MTEQPIYRLELNYTHDEYQKFFNFYKSVITKTPMKLVMTLIASVIIGVLVSYISQQWICVGLFVALGAVLDAYIVWSQKKVDEKVYMAERRSMPIVYRFYEDRLEVLTSSGDKSSTMYHDLYTVYEVDTAFYIMFDKNTVCIIPKSKCPEGMEDFIRDLGRKKQEWLDSQQS